MARESCNLDKDEAEILKPSSSSSPTPSPAAPPSAPPSLFLKPTPPQEFTAQRTDRQEAAVVEEEKQPDEESQPGIRFTNRCSSCRKKVGLTGFRCRCGELFCPRHRYSDTHDCSFDYKTTGRVEISKNNPVVRAAKIIRI